MLEVVFANVLDTKVVYCKVESDRAGFVLEETGCVQVLVVAVNGEAFLEKFVGQNAGDRTFPCKFPCRRNHLIPCR